MAVRGRKRMWSVAAGLSPVEMCPANAHRLCMIVRNVGTKTAFLGVGKDVSKASPVSLAAGADFRDSWSWDGWWACTDNKDGTTLALIEISR